MTEASRARARAAGLASAVLGALAWLLCAGFDEKYVTDRLPAPRAPQSASRRAVPAPEPDIDPTTLYVEHCGADEHLRAYAMGLDSPRDWSGSWRELTTDEFHCVAAGPRHCSAAAVPAGELSLRQGTHALGVGAARGRAERFDCRETCSVTVTVQAAGRCAARGTVEAYGSAPGPATVAAGWEAGTPLRLSAMNCDTYALVFSASGCATQRAWLGEGVGGELEVWMSGERPVPVRVRDADTGEPVAGACMGSAVPYSFTCTDANGVMIVDGGRIRGESIRKSGYATCSPQRSYPGDSGFLEIDMFATVPVRVRCRDGDDVCPSGTRVVVSGQSANEAFGEPCSRVAPGEYRCDAVDGDTVVAWLDGRNAQPPPRVEGPELTIRLNPPASDGCVRLVGVDPEACTVDWPNGPPGARGQSGRSTLDAVGRFSTQYSPGSALDVLLSCPTGVWTGDLTLGYPGDELSCRDVELVEYGHICSPETLRCMAESSVSATWAVRHVWFRGCSDPLWPGGWEVECDDGYTAALTLLPGQTLEVSATD